MLRILFFGAVLALGATGCSTASKLAPVSGKITYKGAPCDGALVVFHPLESDRVNDPKPVATTAADGTYNLTSFAENDGAEPGEYGVTVVWNAPAKEAKMSISGEGSVGSDRLKGSYGNPASTKLKAKIDLGKLNEVNFDLN